MKNNIILVAVARIMMPLIIALGFYIQINGSNAPGGGFQAGAVMASALILFSLACGESMLKQVMPFCFLKISSVLGILIYGGAGILCLIYGGNFLEYSVLENKFFPKQTLGVSIIEWGVALTVFSVFSLLYMFFTSVFTD